MYRIIIDGDDAEDILGILRAIGANKNVDISEERYPFTDPLEGIVHYLGRISNHLNRISRDTPAISTTATKIDRLSDLVEQALKKSQ